MLLTPSESPFCWGKNKCALAHPPRPGLIDEGGGDAKVNVPLHSTLVLATLSTDLVRVRQGMDGWRQ